MFRNFFIVFIEIFWLTGCASNLSTSKEEDLVTKFDLGNEQMAKFKTVQNMGSEPEQNAPVEANEKINPDKNKVSEVQDQKATGQNVEMQASDQPESDEEVIEETPEKIDMPAGYPEAYVAYDARFKEMWSLFKPVFFVGEEFTMSIKYLGLNAGTAYITTMEPVLMGDKKVWHIKAKLKSADYYKYIYQLDDTIESYISTESFLPLKYQLIQRESAQEIDDLQLFDAEKLKTFFWYRRLKRGILNKQEQSNHMPKYIQDSFSALYFARGLPLVKGVVYEYPVVTRAKIWIIKLEVVAREELTFKKSKIMALKLKAETRFPGILKKKGDINFWISDDEKRLFLKFNAKVKIGSISGDLLDYRGPGEKGLKH
ncbi:MAG: hypothetical protein A2381_02330 [Bdellovibrionales bacterium RIFOXYB1_FULL_37_110]|nr:MAG: hypothetical protein A2417_13635 [Bdellovibrionales bacterium RIFOXYC1_FULL_37_79]OFZ59274.1 MAG: hypothetical protein A2381_02330 [Bdellovibrionales bacterium RIFOXYB1_FULL_37_110]OFZ62900.1 MAG: hypothetical protein A2577_11285 [Bdellovibrionales bacterium RIFOXYD1_FULL_36_51]